MTAPASFTVDGLPVLVKNRDVRYFYLRFKPGAAHVELVAPLKAKEEQLHAFVLAKRAWLTKHRNRFADLPTPKQYVAGEEQEVLGSSYPLKLLQVQRGERAVFADHNLWLHIKAEAPFHRRATLMKQFYRETLGSLLPQMVERWQEAIGLEVSSVRLRSMKARWGSCWPQRKAILFNTTLAKAPLPSIELVVVHELLHLLEPSHNKRFYQLIGEFLPDWRQRLERLQQIAMW